MAIVPRKNYLVYLTFAVILLLGFGFGFSHFFVKNYMPLLFMAVVAAGVIVMTCVVALREIKAGPWLIWHTKTGKVEFSRKSRTVAVDDVIGFQQITGRGVFKNKPITELNILVKRNQDGQIERIQLIGSQSRNVVNKISITLAKQTGLELHRLKENSLGQITKRETLQF